MSMEEPPDFESAPDAAVEAEPAQEARRA